MLRKISLGCAAFLLSASVGLAQRSVRLGLAANGAIPVGTYSDRHSGGAGILGSLTIASNEDAVIGIRLDGSTTRIAGRRLGGEMVPSYNIISVTANVVATMSSEYLKPYAVLGGGWYSYRDSVSTDKRQNRAGLQGGVGVTFPFILSSGFLEVRYHRIFQSDVQKRYIGLSAGLLL